MERFNHNKFFVEDLKSDVALVSFETFIMEWPATLEEAMKIVESYVQLNAIMIVTRPPKVVHMMDKKRHVKKNQKEKEERAFITESLFTSSKSEILRD